jgi:hypothetical protein
MFVITGPDFLVLYPYFLSVTSSIVLVPFVYSQCCHCCSLRRKVRAFDCGIDHLILPSGAMLEASLHAGASSTTNARVFLGFPSLISSIKL